MKKLALPLLAVLLAATAACGSTTTTAAKPADPAASSAGDTSTTTTTTTTSSTLDPGKPCAAIDTQAVEAAYGGSAAQGTTDPTLPGRCTWTVTGSKNGDGRVSLFFAQVQSRTAFDAAENGLPGIAKVPGVGDAAYFSPMTDALSVVVGDHWFTTQGTFPGKGDLRTADIALARAALAH